MKNYKRPKRLLLLGLISIVSSCLCLGQSLPEAKTIKQIDEHSYVVEIGGKRFKAVDDALLNEQARSFDTLNAELKACEGHNQEKAAQIAGLENEKVLMSEIVKRADAQRDSALADATRARDDARHYLGLSVKLDTLLTESRQFVPHGNVGGFGGKILKLLDSSYGQAAFKLVIPAAQFSKTYFGRCQP